MTIITPTLQLGDFVFTGVEEPESLTFGKEQSSYKHILIGGGRVIDLLGAGDPDISWSGFFIGPQATLRARYMDGLVSAAKPLLLKTSSFVKEVAIIKFEWDYHKVWPIQYRITLEVIQDKTNPVTTNIPGDITFAVQSAILQAQDIAALIGDGTVNSLIALALIAVDNAAPLDDATNVKLISAVAASQAAAGAISRAINTLEGGLI